MAHRKLLFISIFTTSMLVAQSSVRQTPESEAELYHFGSEINSPYVEYTPFITPDEKILFFESNRPGGVGQTGDFDLWYSERVEMTSNEIKFARPVNVGAPVNSRFFDGLPSLRKRPDGSFEMYFTSFSSEEREGDKETNIYYSEQVNNRWSKPKAVIEINTDFHDRMPSISPDGSRLYFSSNRPGGIGKDDLWYSDYDLSAKKWKRPVNLGTAINGPEAEVSPSIHSDGVTLYFSSDRSGGVGGYDMYVTQKESNNNWRQPQNLGKPYNSKDDDEYPTVPQEGNYMYFTSNRSGGFGSFDIYRAKVPEFAKPEIVVIYEGVVIETGSQKGIEANIQIEDGQRVRNLSTSLPDGNYNIDLVNKKQHKLTISAPGYVTQEHMIDLRTTNESKKITRNFQLERAYTLPEKITLVIPVRDENGRPITEGVSFAVSPDGQSNNPSKFNTTTKSFEHTVIITRNLQNEQALNNYLKANKLEVNLKVEGFEEKSIKKPLNEIIVKDRNEISDRYALDPIILRKATVASRNSNSTTGNNNAVVAANNNSNENTSEPTATRNNRNDNKPAGDNTTADRSGATSGKPGANDKPTGSDNTSAGSNNKSTSSKPRSDTVTDNDTSDSEKSTARNISDADIVLYFPTASSAHLGRKEREKLDKLKEIIKKGEYEKIVVHGHTDRRGDWPYNVRLSKARANYVKRLLEKMGAKEEKIEAEWFAFGRPVEKKYTAAAYRKNRRVEIYIETRK